MVYRFMKEYANYITKNGFIDTLDVKKELQIELLKNECNKILFYRRKGLITVDETMKLLNNISIFDLINKYKNEV